MKIPIRVSLRRDAGPGIQVISSTMVNAAGFLIYSWLFVGFAAVIKKELLAAT